MQSDPSPLIGLFVFIWLVMGFVGLIKMFQNGVLNLGSSCLILFFVGPIAIPLAIMSGPISFLIAGIRKRCPDCKKSIPTTASVCNGCGRKFNLT